MDLIECQPQQLFLGMSLRYTLRDKLGQILLAKGQRIESQQQLDAIRDRKIIFVEIDESDDGVRVMMSGISALTNADAPIKDFSKYLKVSLTTQVEEKLSGTLVQQWGDLESKLGGLLASVETTIDLEGRVKALGRSIAAMLANDATGSQFLLFNRSVTHFGGYSVLHSLLCAALASLLAKTFSLSDDERNSLVCAALTMNVAMTRLQDQLALQNTAPSAHQRAVIDSHAAKGRAVLEQAGVLDAAWLEVVARHHTTLTGSVLLSDWPSSQRMTRILQTIDRYTAAMSPRKSRLGRTARDSVRSVVLLPGEARQDEVGAALIRMLGLSPPGTFVKLANGETAVVVRRGTKPAEPWVASVLNRHDEPIAEPRLRDTSAAGLAIQSTLTATSVRVNLNLDLMLRMIPK